uniref:RRM domain-containing protein n=1 Tax=Anopheles atroparvus TaxID=41427 RepID=A0AAG5DD17_ANOAO
MYKKRSSTVQTKMRRKTVVTIKRIKSNNQMPPTQAPKRQQAPMEAQRTTQYAMTTEELKEHFSQYGDIESINVKTDPNTGRSRGFAFIVYKSADSIEKVVAVSDHTINNKKVDPKKAKARHGKIFVGGLTSEISDEEIKTFFGQFGNIVEVEMPFDKQKNQRKGFCFITFDSEQVVNELLKTPKQTISGKEVDVKKATPKPDNMGPMGPMGGRGGMRGPPPRGMRGGRGGPGGPKGKNHHHTPPHKHNHNHNHTRTHMARLVPSELFLSSFTRPAEDDIYACVDVDNDDDIQPTDCNRSLPISLTRPGLVRSGTVSILGGYGQGWGGQGYGGYGYGQGYSGGYGDYGYDFFGKWCQGGGGGYSNGGYDFTGYGSPKYNNRSTAPKKHP